VSAETNENTVFKFGYAEPPPILFKNSESREQKKQVYLIFYAETHPVLLNEIQTAHNLCKVWIKILY